MIETTKTTGYFRRIVLKHRVYYIPVTEQLAKLLPMDEIFFGTFKQAMRLEKLKLVRR